MKLSYFAINSESGARIGSCLAKTWPRSDLQALSDIDQPNFCKIKLEL